MMTHVITASQERTQKSLPLPLSCVASYQSHKIYFSVLIFTSSSIPSLPTVDVKPEIPLTVEPLSPLDLRTDLRMLGPGSDPGLWERQLQQELLLIQKQQQIQKQLLISEFQKQHEKLTRQHQAQLQEHLKVSAAPHGGRHITSGQSLNTER